MTDTPDVASKAIDNRHIVSETLLPTPAEICAEAPLSPRAEQTVLGGRQSIERILRRADPRIFLVVGPCSIHDVRAAEEYATKLHALSQEVADTLVLVMRVYFEKPRTTVGWKGFINDPFLDNSFRIEEGLRRARSLLLHIAELGLPVGTETLDPLNPQFLIDLISWAAIGARTAESQTHREIASGLSTPVGIKNGTDGNIDVAINALKSAAHEHRFLGVTKDGRCGVFHTRGNPHCHVILRGGQRRNYDSVSVALCENRLGEEALPKNIVIDCSHGNSLKNPELQPLVLENGVMQIVEGNRSIVGFMLESHLEWGNQEIPADPTALRYGVSVTDACMGWEKTEEIIRTTHEKLSGVLPTRIGEDD